MSSWNKLWSRPAPRQCSNPGKKNKASLRIETLETRDAMSASPQPVLMVIANQDFYDKEFG